MMALVPKWLLPTVAGMAAAALATPALAQDGAEFYKGKTVNYIVATAPGGGYDAYGRLVAEYMQRYLPGSTFIVKNMPGAGHIIGANAIYLSKADGLTLGTFNTGLIYNQLIKQQGVRFDLTKMSWIGKAASEPRVFVVPEGSPIKTFKDLETRKEPVNFSTAGVGSASYVETTMLAHALHLPAKILTGYNGSDDQLAMRRGEIEAAVASKSSWEQFVKNGYGRFLVQIGGSDKDTPQLAPQVTDPKAKSLIALIQSQGDIARLTAGPPGIPADRLAALRDAYRKAMDDKELQARAEKMDRPVEPLIGDDVLKAVKEALDQSPEIVALLKDSLEKKDNSAAPAKN
jgi:putative tricarboxylic transport membrane protein